jgi:hypothetical protein
VYLLPSNCSNSFASKGWERHARKAAMNPHDVKLHNFMYRYTVPDLCTIISPSIYRRVIKQMQCEQDRKDEPETFEYDMTRQGTKHENIQLLKVY